MSRIYALFWRTFSRPKKYGGVPKMTNMRYGTNARWWQNLQVAPPGDQNLQTMGHHIVATDSVEQR